MHLNNKNYPRVALFVEKASFLPSKILKVEIERGDVLEQDSNVSKLETSVNALVDFLRRLAEM